MTGIFRRIYQPRGKVLGGSGSMNGMIWVRGHPKNYDKWAEVTKNEKWGYQHFKTNLDAVYRNVKNNGDDGHSDNIPVIPISKLAWQHPLSEKFLDACEQFGIPRVPNFHEGIRKVLKCISYKSYF